MRLTTTTILVAVALAAVASMGGDIDRQIKDWEAFYRSMKKAGIPESLVTSATPGYMQPAPRGEEGTLSILAGWAEANKKTPATPKRIVASSRTMGALPFDKTRMVGEVTTPGNDEERKNQEEELAYFRSLGYNGALVVWNGEDSSYLGSLTSKLRKEGWKILMAVGAPEDHFAVKVRAVGALRRAMSDVLPSCDAISMLWRGTSGDHLDAEGRMVVARVVSSMGMESSPMMPIAGDRFVRRDGSVVTNDSPVASMSLVMNIGFSCTDRAAAYRGLVGKPSIVVIIGPTPYYRSANPRPDLSDKDVIRINGGLEDFFLGQTNVIGTIMLAGDGYGDRVRDGRQFSDSLIRSHWRDSGWAEPRTDPRLKMTISQDTTRQGQQGGGGDEKQ